MLHHKLPPNLLGKDFVVGDIHGEYDLLLEELGKLNFDFKKDRLFSVGDLVDRGPKSQEVLELALQDWFIPVRGNHEQFCVSSYYDTTGDMVESHICNGGGWFHSLDVSVQKELVDIVKTLPIMMETAVDGKSIGFVHADITDWDSSVFLIKDLEESHLDSNLMVSRLIWGRTRITNKITTPCKGIDHVFLGHTPLYNVTTLSNTSFIDTGACFSEGFLSILNISDYLADK